MDGHLTSGGRPPVIGKRGEGDTRKQVAETLSRTSLFVITIITIIVVIIITTLTITIITILQSQPWAWPDTFHVDAIMQHIRSETLNRKRAQWSCVSSSGANLIHPLRAFLRKRPALSTHTKRPTTCTHTCKASVYIHIYIYIYVYIKIEININIYTYIYTVYI